MPAAQPAEPQSADQPGGGFWHDVFNPQAADLSRPQTWRDWMTKTYYPTATDFGKSALDDVSLGGADYAQSKLTGEDINAIRTRTAASQAALGPMAPVVGAAAYVAGPGKVLGPLAKGGKVVGAMLEGGAAGAISSEGHDLGSDKSQADRALDALKAGGESAIFSAGGNLAARGVASAAQPAFNAAQGAPGRAGDPVFGNWRAASAAGQDISPAVQQFQDASGHDMSGVLAAQKIGTGPLSDMARNAMNLAFRTKAGALTHGMSYYSDIPGKLSDALHDAATARMRDYETQRALDRAYPRVAGSPLNADTSGWTRAIQQGFIGGSRP